MYDVRREALDLAIMSIAKNSQKAIFPSENILGFIVFELIKSSYNF